MRAPITDLHLVLYPRPHNVGLVGELAAEVVVGLLSPQLLLQCLVTLRDQLSDLEREPGQ